MRAPRLRNTVHHMKALLHDFAFRALLKPIMEALLPKSVRTVFIFMFRLIYSRKEVKRTYDSNSMEGATLKNMLIGKQSAKSCFKCRLIQNVTLNELS